jgi:GT2 family glycosyltransferase
VAVEVSIIIPTHNRREILCDTLRSLAAVDFPVGRWEIVVVDDGSTDGTAEGFQACAESCGAPARLVCQDNRGPAAARNHGAREARSPILIWLDDDIGVVPDFVTLHVEALRAHPGCWILGRIIQNPQMERTPFGRFRAQVWEAFHNAQVPDAVSETSGISAANLSMPRHDFLSLGGFDEAITIASCEDMLLGIAARASGIRTLYHPGIVGVHNDWAVDLPSFCRRQRLYSISDVLLWNRLLEASPRAHLVRENTGLSGSGRHPLGALKRLVKRFFGTRGGDAFVKRLVGIGERVAPDTRLCRALYKLAIAAAIYKGVQEGVARYGLRRAA